MTNNPKYKDIYHLLITSLFYPAVLGAIFYSLLGSIYHLKLNINSVLQIITLLAIVIIFSFDFLYSWISKDHYSGMLFSLDLAILLLIYISYNSLLQGIIQGSSIALFFICFIIMHILYVIWDYALIPKERADNNIILYDLIGLITSILGYCFLRDNIIIGIIVLWLLTIETFLTVGLISIKKITEA